MSAVSDAAKAQFLLDPIFHAKVVTLVHTILNVVESADEDYALTAEIAHAHQQQPPLTQRDMRTDRLLLAVAECAVDPRPYGEPNYEPPAPDPELYDWPKGQPKPLPARPQER
jgi:hypothetical protein